MSRLTPVQVTTPAPKVRDLTQQNADFTAEGSPPPGMVGSTVPALAEQTLETAQHLERRKPPADRRRAPGDRRTHAGSAAAGTP